MLIHLLVILLSPWWWIILQRNLLVGLLIAVLSFVLFIYFWLIRSGKVFIILVILTIVIVSIITREAFDESIFRNSSLDVQQINKRHEFYANNLGKIYTNRFSLIFFKEYSLPIYKLQKNLFSNLDTNLYFFASHPRERAGVEEFKKYSPIFLPFFLIGFLYLLYVPLLGILIYSVPILFLYSIISPGYELGPLLFFPVINFFITIGIILSIKKIKEIIKRRK